MNTGTWEILASSHPGLRQSAMRMDRIALEKLTISLIKELITEDIDDLRLRTHCLSILSADTFDTDPAKSGELMKISEANDQLYFDMTGRGEPEEVWSSRFHQARLAYALYLAHSGINKTSMGDILYELSHASKDPAGFLDRADAIATTLEKRNQRGHS